MQVVTPQETKRKDMKTPEYDIVYATYYGEAIAVHQGPQVFLVDIRHPGGTVAPHFHDIDQFQVIVRGGSRLGKIPVEPISFHYADAFTPYGPIVGSEEGVSFLTIRKACAAGYYPMPEARHLLPGKPGRNIAGKFPVNRPLPAGGESSRETLLTAEDGVEVVGLRFGANARASGEPSDAGDQYYLVCTGSLVHGEKEVPPMTLVHVAPGEPAPTFQAGAAGAQLLLTQLPRASERPGSDVEKLAARKIDYKLPEGVAVE